jgi:hypothetical protein
MSNHSCNCLIAVADSRGLFFIAAWLFSFGLNAQTAALNLQVERDSVGLGEPVALTLTSDESLLGGQHWAWPEFQPGDTLSQGWEILSVGTLDSTTSPEMEAGIRRSQRLVVLAWDTGLKVIEPFKLTPSEGPLVSSSPFLMQVGLATFETNPAPMPLQGYRPFAWSWWERFLHVLPWIIGTLAAAGLLAWGIRKWNARSRFNTTPEEAAEPQEPAHVVALRMLYHLQDSQPWATGSGKESQAQLSEAVRLHLQGTFGIKALERATEELTSQLNESATRGIDPPDVLWLTRLLRQSDLVKFAKQTMGHDAHVNAIQGAIQWVERTAPNMHESPDNSQASSPDIRSKHG